MENLKIDHIHEESEIAINVCLFVLRPLSSVQLREPQMQRILKFRFLLICSFAKHLK